METLKGKTYSAEQVGQELGIGRNNFYSMLRSLNIFKANNLPYNKFSGQGLFKIGHYTLIIDEEEVPKKKILFTEKGYEWIVDKIKTAMEEVVL